MTMKIMYSLLIYILIALLNVIKLLIVTFKKYFALNYFHTFFTLCLFTRSDRLADKTKYYEINTISLGSNGVVSDLRVV